MNLNISTYEREIIQPLTRLENKGLGKTFELADGVIGFIKGKAPKILITACHHASEIYGTYGAILDFLGNTVHEVIAIPVVDVTNFCYYRKQSSEFLSDNYDEYWHVCFINDFIKGYKGIKPKKLKWQYGDHGAIKLIKEITRIIHKCDLLIDIHNTVTNKYMVITSSIHRSKEMEYLGKILGKIAEVDGVYTGSLGVGFNKLDDGLFECLNEKSITAYAAKKGVINLALEIPVLSDTQSLRDFDELAELNCFLLEYAINQYNIIYGRK